MARSMRISLQVALGNGRRRSRRRPRKLARRLTAVGLEVEAIERLGAGLAGVVAARVLASDKHPNAEKLSVTRVDAGQGEPLQIVCGARNYQVGDVVPLATGRRRAPRRHEDREGQARGVESFGMLCSARELALSDDAGGLLILPADVAPGHAAGAARWGSTTCSWR